MRNKEIDPFNGLDIANQYSSDPEINDIAENIWTDHDALYRSLLDFIPNKKVDEFRKQFELSYKVKLN
jgi:hypothetical protein